MKSSFVARMPNRAGALHRVADIITRHEGNINRINYNRRIDPETVFFEVTCDRASYRLIEEELRAIGYLQTTLKPLHHLKFHVHLPHRSGALFEFLQYTTRARANIAYIDFDDSGRQPERVTISLDIEESTVADKLLNRLKSRYPLEIIEYDDTGAHLDNTVFYVRFAQKIRPFIPDAEGEFLLSFLQDVNHIVQELTNLGEEPRKVFESILQTGTYLNGTTGEGFHADLQRIPVTDAVTLYCFQLPAGGSVYLLDGPGEQFMVDTGYGIYHSDIRELLQSHALWNPGKLSRQIITHADADHCGGGGYFDVPALMHTGTLEIIRRNNRAYGSRSEGSILEAFYTTMINLFSRFRSPEKVSCLPEPGEDVRCGFPVLDRISIGDIVFEVLESHGGHLHGQIFLYAPIQGILFTGDSLMNFASFTTERERYNSLADFLITSVNVDSNRARSERHALLELVAETDRNLADEGKQCLICGGHGAVSILKEGKLEVYGEVEHYSPESLS